MTTKWILLIGGVATGMATLAKAQEIPPMGANVLTHSSDFVTLAAFAAVAVAVAAVWLWRALWRWMTAPSSKVPPDWPVSPHRTGVVEPPSDGGHVRIIWGDRGERTFYGEA